MLADLTAAYLLEIINNTKSCNINIFLSKVLPTCMSYAMYYIYGTISVHLGYTNITRI